MKCRTGTHSAVEVRRALSQGVVLLGCPQWPHQAKADGHFPKRKADGNAWLSRGPEAQARRIVRWGKRHGDAQVNTSRTRHVASSNETLAQRHSGNRLLVEASHHLYRDPGSVLFEFTETVPIRATAGKCLVRVVSSRKLVAQIEP